MCYVLKCTYHRDIHQKCEDELIRIFRLAVNNLFCLVCVEVGCDEQLVYLCDQIERKICHVSVIRSLNDV